MLPFKEQKLILTEDPDFNFFTLFLNGRMDINDFLIMMYDAEPKLLAKGFSKQDVRSIKDKAIELGTGIKSIDQMFPKIQLGKQQSKIKLGKITPSNVYNFLEKPWKGDIDVFIREAREFLVYSMRQNRLEARQEFLERPTQQEVFTSETIYLCQRLGIDGIAFLFKRYSTKQFAGHHIMLITKVETTPPKRSLIGKSLGLFGYGIGQTRIYDSIRGDISSIPTKELIKDELLFINSGGRELGDRIIMTTHLENKLIRYTESKKLTTTEKITSLHFLSDIKYALNEDFARAIGRIQFDAHNCGILVVLAALLSKRGYA